MKDNTKKELIEEIIGQLKDHELPYKEGSWEKFASKYNTASPGSSNWKYWSAAAAVLLCFGLGYWNLKENTAINSPSTVLKLDTHNKEVLADNKDLKESIQRSLSDVTKDRGLTSQELYAEKPFTYSKEKSAPVVNHINAQVPLVAGQTLGGHNIMFSDRFAGIQSMQQRKANMLSAHLQFDETSADDTKALKTGLQSQVESSKIGSNNQIKREADQLSRLYAQQQGNTRSSVVLNQDSQDKKWEMGAFVSPASTSESITLGGGVALAYNVSSKVGIRSGASIQHYGAISGSSPITPAVASNSFTADAPNYISQSTANNAFVMRTADAKEAKSNERVSGKILTVDIPVDVRYAISKNFYTSVGVSYVGVLDQERATIYETNNTEYRQKSSDKNVADKGVNGFLNFSVGRKQKVGKLSISVEPYYKAPIGGLRSSDLNYSNGGVKIITSF